LLEPVWFALRGTVAEAIDRVNARAGETGDKCNPSGVACMVLTSQAADKARHRPEERA
jgi:hypothetical protein